MKATKEIKGLERLSYGERLRELTVSQRRLRGSGVYVGVGVGGGGWGDGRVKVGAEISSMCTNI